MKTLKLLYAQVRAKYRKEEDSQSAKEQHKKSPPETCGENYFQTNSILAVKRTSGNWFPFLLSCYYMSTSRHLM